MRFNQGYSQGFNRGLSFGGFTLTPFIKYMLLINVAVFIAQLIFPEITYMFGLTPARFFSEFPNLLYQPLTYMFLHGGFGHIFFNMFVLWMFGTEIEGSFGTKAFGRFYIFSGLAGALLTLMVNYSQAIPIIGASGAIYGVLAAYWVLFPNRLVYIYFLFPVKVKWMVPGMMILGFLFGGPNVAHFAHLGGALYGVLYMKTDWRWNWLSNKITNLRYKRQSAKLEKRREEATEVMRRVDEILDKINEIGIENISKSDRKFLEDASSQLARKKE